MENNNKSNEALADEALDKVAGGIALYLGLSAVNAIGMMSLWEWSTATIRAAMEQ